MIRIGVDIGGTFTDFALWKDSTGDGCGTYRHKVPSTPPHFADAIKSGFEHMLQAGLIRSDDPLLIVHGMTVGTNAILERSAEPVGLLVTEGFRDLLEIARMRLPKLLDFHATRPAPLVAREHVFEVRERIMADGKVDTPLASETVLAGAQAARNAGLNALAVCFLHSHVNPAHEEAARQVILKAFPDMDVVTSTSVLRREAEYERAMLAVLNAYVKPIMGTYLAKLGDYIKERLPSARLLIAASNGGVMSAEEARAFPVHTLLSGPAAGVTAAHFLGDQLAVGDLLTMDMGGTSTDISLIHRGRPITSSQAQIGDFPITLPVTSIEAVGAGGGSIAWIDSGVLRVGPHSASALPGPACYGRGGKLPTLSDAYLLCGLLGDTLLGGELPLNRSAAETAFAPLAAELGLSILDVAQSCVAIATASMTAKVLPFLARIGVEPQQLAMIAFGGAGGLHGPLLAQQLGIGRILVPSNAPVFCAAGCMVSHIVHDMVRTLRRQAPELVQAFDDLGRDARAWLLRQIEETQVIDVSTERYVSMRYKGQSFQLDVAVDETCLRNRLRLDERFHSEHQRAFGHSDPAAPTEIIEARLRIRGRLPIPTLAEQAATGSSWTTQQAITRSRRDILLDNRSYDAVPVYRRETLSSDFAMTGPSLIEQADTITLVPVGYRATLGAAGTLVLDHVGTLAAPSPA